MLPRSKPCIFLGYSLNQSAYLCYDPSSQKLYVSRHVQFDKSSFPSVNHSHTDPIVTSDNFHSWLSTLPHVSSLPVTSTATPPASTPPDSAQLDHPATSPSFGLAVDSSLAQVPSLPPLPSPSDKLTTAQNLVPDLSPAAQPAPDSAPTPIRTYTRRAQRPTLAPAPAPNPSSNPIPETQQPPLSAPPLPQPLPPLTP